jgi:ketosteroid isomerase-like protein
VNDETTRATIEAVKRLDAAFDRGDLDAFMAAMTNDCVWESSPPPLMGNATRARRRYGRR